MESSKEFKYMGIAKYIRKKIEEDVYKIGEYIASQREIAKALNVNRASIKNAIKVLETEGVLECIPSVGSKVIKKPSNNTLIGYIVRSLKDPFHLEMIREMDKLLSEKEAGLIVSEGNSSKRLLDMGATKIIKGGQLENTIEEDIVNTLYIGSEGIPRNTISIDNKKGMELIYKHLYNLGHRRIVFISTAIENLAKNIDKRFSYLIESANSILEKEYISNYSIFLKSYSEEECNNVIKEILTIKPAPTALVCSSDWLAIEILQSALTHNLKVPEDISITGFDNIYMSSILNIPLTTVDFPFLEAAQKAVELLFNDDNKETHIVCKPTLVTRMSTSRAREIINF